MTLSPALSADVGRHNMSLVMAAAAEHAPCSRSEIRMRTGLVSGTVTTMVEELTARGLLIETGNVQGSRGRPRRLLTPAPDRIRTVAVQLFPGTVVGEVRDFAGQILWTETWEHRTARGDAQGFVSVLVGMLDVASERASTTPNAWITDPIIVVPAIVKSDSSIVAALPLGLRNADLRAPLMQSLKHPRKVSLMNDGRLSALAEYDARPFEDRPRAMAYVGSRHEGVGGGLVIDGEIYSGSHGLGGLVGHISVDMCGPACSCGARGCLELYLSLRALLNRAALDPSHSLAQLIERLEQGDCRARTALDEGGRALTTAIGTMSNYTDIDIVVLGGILPPLFPWLEPHLTELLSTRARMVPQFKPEIALATYGLEAPKTGAWLHARNSILYNPSAVPYL